MALIYAYEIHIVVRGNDLVAKSASGLSEEEFYGFDHGPIYFGGWMAQWHLQRSTGFNANLGSYGNLDMEFETGQSFYLKTTVDALDGMYMTTATEEEA